MLVWVFVIALTFTTAFVDTRLWKTKHSWKRFQKFPSIIRVINMLDRNPPITDTSVTFYVMLMGCDWWISIRHVDNTYDWQKFLETFPRVFCFPKSRINENGGNSCQTLYQVLFAQVYFVRITLIYLLFSYQDSFANMIMTRVWKI